MWCATSDKQTSGGTTWAAFAQIPDQGLPDVMRQRQSLALLSLAGDDHDTLVPVNIIQRHHHHFSGAQCQARQQQHDGVVAPTDRRRAVAGPEHGLDLLRSQHLGQARQSPVHDRENRSGKITGSVTALIQMAQEAAQCRRVQFGGRPAGLMAVAQDEPVTVLAGQSLKSDGVCPEVFAEKAVNDRKIAVDRGRTQTSLPDQEAFSAGFDPPDRIIATGTR